MANSVSRQQRKAEHQKKTAELRAKLIEERQKVALASEQAGALALATTTLKSASPRLLGKENEIKQELPSDDLFSPESLKAAAKATAAAQARLRTQEKAVPFKALLPKIADASVAPTHLRLPQPDPTPLTGEGIVKMSLDETKKLITQRPETTAAWNADYPDIKLWLELTGYHNVEYRNSSVAAYKRQQLETQAADIRDRLQELQKEEAAVGIWEASIPAFFNPRTNIFFQTARNGQAPELPQLAAATTGQHNRQPKPFPADSSNAPSNRGRSGPPRFNGPLERRISYPDRRSRSPNRRNVHTNRDGRQHRVRDVSLERRQQYYTFPHEHDLYRPPCEDH